MYQCEVCGNQYDKPIIVSTQGRTHIFDCFECAIQALAPVCLHCGCRIIGHGVQVAGKIFCCAHCATREGMPGVKEHYEPGLVST